MPCAKCGTEATHTTLTGEKVCAVCGYAALPDEKLAPIYDKLADIAATAGLDADEKGFEMVEVLSVELAEKEAKCMEVDALKARVRKLEDDLARACGFNTAIRRTMVRYETQAKCLRDGVNRIMEAPLRDGRALAEAVADAIPSEEVARKFCMNNSVYRGSHGPPCSAEIDYTDRACDLANCINEAAFGDVEVLTWQEICDYHLDTDNIADNIADFGDRGITKEAMLEEMEGAADEQDLHIESVELLVENSGLYADTFGPHDYFVVWE